MLALQLRNSDFASNPAWRRAVMHEQQPNNCTSAKVEQANVPERITLLAARNKLASKLLDRTEESQCCARFCLPAVKRNNTLLHHKFTAAIFRWQKKRCRVNDDRENCNVTRNTLLSNGRRA